MFKTISAALVAASLLFAPGLSASADAAQGATTTKTVKVVKKGPRHVVRHTRHKHVKFVRGHKKFVVIKKTRNGKIVKAHRHSHVIVAKPRVRAN